MDENEKEIIQNADERDYREAILSIIRGDKIGRAHV